MVAELLNKYIWLVESFVRVGEGGMLLEEVCDRWESRWGTEYTRRTFANHRAAIEEVFGISIKCNRSTNCYYIPSGEDVADTSWLVNTFTVNNLLSLGRERLAGRVAVEDIPSGRRWLTELMGAMEDNAVVVLVYRKYTGGSDETLHVRPYAVKEFEKRWYLVGYAEERKALRVYGLDRIMSLEKTAESFRMPSGFDVDELFASSFGIYLPEKERARRILFRATEKEARYLRDLPLHGSQTEMADGGSEEYPYVFSIRVVPNDSLVMEFCRHGSRIEVLEPAEIRSAVAVELEKATKLYI